ncbi:MAG: hypothetical protein GY756_23775 [bacterium]|nr:hypothetical protein [bacterium]
MKIKYLPKQKNRAKIKLFSYDTGFLHLKKALRTVFSVLMSAGLTYYLVSPPAAILAGFSAVFLNQANVGKKRKEKLFSLVIAFLTFELMVLIAQRLHFDIVSLHIIFILLCFPAFYLRRFGEFFNLFPPMSLVLMQVAGALPLGGGVYTFCFPVVLAFAVSLVFQLYFLTKVIKPEIYDGLIYLTDKYYGLVRKIAEGVQKNKHARYYEIYIKNDHDLFEVFKHIQESLEIHKSDENIKTFILTQYSFIKSLDLLLENIAEISHSELEDNLKFTLHKLLIEICRILSNFFDVYQNHIDKNISFESLDQKIFELRKIKKGMNFREHKEYVIYISNIIFAFIRIQHLIQEQHKLFKLIKEND